MISEIRIQVIVHQNLKRIHLVLVVCISGVFVRNAKIMQPTMPIALHPETQEGANASLAVVWVNFPGTSFAPNTLVLFTLVNLSINLPVSNA